MKQLTINIDEIQLSNNLPFVLFGGMNVLEARDTVMKVCEHYVTITQKLNIPYIFKASFDKANRSSIDSYRGIGFDKSMILFQELKRMFGVKIITDIHEPAQAEIVSKIVDVIQLPAFLSRQTDLIISMAQTGSIINIKKPIYINPVQVKYIVDKFRRYGNNKIILCDRGTTFGYDNLIVDMLGFNIMSEVSGGCPVIFDVTHSLQTRDSYQPFSGGKATKVYELARAGIAVGIAGLFLEAHPNPRFAKCDGPSALPLNKLEFFLKQVKLIDDLIKSLVSV